MRADDTPAGPQAPVAGPEWAKAAAAAALAVSVFGLVQIAAIHPVGVDGLFHMQTANLIRDNLPQPWMPEFRWLEHTSLNHDSFADFYWGYHLLLLPFTVFQVELAAKIAPVVLSSMSLMVLFFVLGRFGVRHRLLWFSIALLASPIFLMRLSQNKASTAMLGLLLLLTWALVGSRSGWIAVASAAVTWVYPVLPVLGAVAVAGLATQGVFDRKVPWKGILAVGSGIGAGLVLHPDVPRNLAFLVVNLTEATRLRAGEFSPLATDTFLGDLWILVGLFVVAFRFARLHREEPEARSTWTALIVASLMLLVAVRYMRGIDFVPPFVVLFAALSLDAPLGRLAAWCRGRIGGRWAPRVVVAVLAVAFVLGAGAQVARARKIVVSNSTAVAHRLEGAAEWLKANTAPDELVLNLTAGDFEQLWAYNTHNTYLVGFNVRFLQRESPELFRQYARVYELGDLSALHEMLSGDTTARFAVVSDRLPRALLDGIGSSPAFEAVYQDRSCAVIRARP